MLNKVVSYLGFASLVCFSGNAAAHSSGILHVHVSNVDANTYLAATVLGVVLLSGVAVFSVSRLYQAGK